MGLWTLLEGFLLLANALAILNEDRFLAPRGWSMSEVSGNGQTKSLKGQIVGLIYATQFLRMPLIALNVLIIVVKLVSGWGSLSGFAVVFDLYLLQHYVKVYCTQLLEICWCCLSGQKMAVNICNIKALCDGVINLFQIFSKYFLCSLLTSFLFYFGIANTVTHLLLITSVFYGCFLTIVDL